MISPPRHKPYGEGLRCSKCGLLARHHKPRVKTDKQVWLEKPKPGDNYELFIDFSEPEDGLRYGVRVRNGKRVVGNFKTVDIAKDYCKLLNNAPQLKVS